MHVTHRYIRYLAYTQKPNAQHYLVQENNMHDPQHTQTNNTTVHSKQQQNKLQRSTTITHIHTHIHARTHTHTYTHRSCIHPGSCVQILSCVYLLSTSTMEEKSSRWRIDRPIDWFTMKWLITYWCVTHTHTYIHMHTYMHTYIHTYIHTRVYAPVHLYCIHTYKHTRTSSK